MGTFSDVRTAANTILHGMAVTFANMLKPPITVQYPDRLEDNPRVDQLAKGPMPRFRGILEVDTDICTACQACSRACPIDCIAIEVVKLPDKRRVMTRFDIDKAKCMYCGLCTEACPVNADRESAGVSEDVQVACIRHTTEFEAATTDMGTLILSFVTPGDQLPPYKQTKGEASKTRPVGEIARKAIAEAREWSGRRIAAAKAGEPDPRPWVDPPPAPEPVEKAKPKAEPKEGADE